MILNILLDGAASKAGGLGQFLPLLLIMVVFFFFMIWPQMKKQKKAKAFMESVQKGNHIVTTGGVHGKIVSVQDTTFTIETEEGRMKIEKGAVSLEMTQAAYKNENAS
ncbi:MAG: preprotein translocase subunit YajC [Bacteroidetes bacterium]|nr:preprotein translocase subunit YajC [Bacteroidota bacterium]